MYSFRIQSLLSNVYVFDFTLLLDPWRICRFLRRLTRMIWIFDNISALHCCVTVSEGAKQNTNGNWRSSEENTLNKIHYTAVIMLLSYLKFTCVHSHVDVRAMWAASHIVCKLVPVSLQRWLDRMLSLCRWTSQWWELVEIREDTRFAGKKVAKVAKTWVVHSKITDASEVGEAYRWASFYFQ